MRRKFPAAASVLLLLALSCEKTPTDIPDPAGDAPASITLDPASATTLEAGASSLSLTITSPVRPTVSFPDWITVKDGTYSNYSITVTLNVSANSSYDSRAGAVTVTAGSLGKTLQITQKGKERPSVPETDIIKEPVTSGTTAKAKELYSWLLSVYGSKIVSSVMADVNWNHRLADNIYKTTGKYPAMNCYDFIQIYVPKNNWIDYADLTPVTEWAAAGGIVSLMWHFNVPVNSTTTPGTDGSGVTCTPSETTFRASNIFIEGSWENEWFYSQMDKVADVILQLQDKGIAALWRPFHEAAGNSTLKSGASWATSWFWWGYDGAEVFKKVWKAMYDYFYGKGIRNLIWVWTSQNFNGDSSSYDSDDDWYPGDGCVDVVARDLYGTAAAGNAAEFNELQARYPKRMIALGECGSTGSAAFASVPSFWEAGAKWSWFSPWYGSNLPDDAWWKEAFAQSYVITRDQLQRP